MLKQRVITALIGLPLLISLIAFAPRWVLSLFFAAFVGVGTWETVSILLPTLWRKLDGSEPSQGLCLRVQLMTVGFAVVVFLTTVLALEETSISLFAASIVSIILAGTFLTPGVDRSMATILAAVTSFVYGCLPWFAIWELYTLGSHGRFLFLLLIVIWFSDTGGYFGGRFWGTRLIKRRLAPSISPKKTWEGVFAGLAMASLGGILADAMFGMTLGPWSLIIPVALAAAALGVLGDLVESNLKRFCGVKDSGRIFPGHGGFLDRVDGLLFAGPLVWFILYCWQT